eukprot:146736_1
MKLSAKTFFITGGGSGLGEAVAIKFVKEGANAILFDLKKSSADAVASKLGDKALACQGDVRNEKQVQAALDEGVSKFGALHGVVNCAGIGPPTRVIGRKGRIHSLKMFQMILDINVVGSFNVLRLASSIMSKQEAQEGGERGVIINTASVAAFDGQIGQAAYSASKGAIVSMTLPLARDLAKFGIRTLTIAPGVFETPMMAMLPQKNKDSLCRQVPFPSRLGSPEEFASLCAEIVRNRYLNGETIRLDGSIRMSAM